MRKTKEEAQKTREQLMQSALDTFLEHGVARTSLAAIARNAGVTRDALYWHFKNKEDLFEALFGQIFSACSASLADGLHESGGHGLRRMLYDMFDRIQSDDTHRKLFTIIHLKCEFTEETRAVFDVQKNTSSCGKNSSTPSSAAAPNAANCPPPSTPTAPSSTCTPLSTASSTSGSTNPKPTSLPSPRPSSTARFTPCATAPSC